MLAISLFLLLIGSLDNNSYTMSEKSLKIQSCSQKQYCITVPAIAAVSIAVEWHNLPVETKIYRRAFMDKKDFLILWEINP